MGLEYLLLYLFERKQNRTFVYHPKNQAQESVSQVLQVYFLTHPGQSPLQIAWESSFNCSSSALF